MFECQGMSWKG